MSQLITYPNKAPGDLFTAAEANEIKEAHNSSVELEKIVIRSIDDFPTPVGGEILLEDGKLYYYDLPKGQQISDGNKLVIPSGGSVRFDGRESVLAPHVYTGAEAMFNASELELFSTRDILFSSPNGSLFNFTSTSPTSAFYIFASTLYDCDSIGSVDGIGTVAIDFSGIIDVAGSLSLNNIYKTLLSVSQTSNATDNGNTLFSFGSGTFNNITLNGLDVSLQPNEYAIYINPAATIGALVGTSCLCNRRDNFFAPGSQDQTQRGHNLIGNVGIPNSIKAASYYMNDNITETDVETAGTGEWVKVAGTTVQGPVLEKFILNGDNEAVFKGNFFQGSVSTVVSATTTNSSDKVYEFGFFKNGVLIPGSITKRTIAADLGAVPVQAVMTMEFDDSVSLYVRHISGTLINVTVTDMNPYIVGLN